MVQIAIFVDANKHANHLVSDPRIAPELACHFALSSSILQLHSFPCNSRPADSKYLFMRSARRDCQYLRLVTEIGNDSHG